MPFSKSFIPQKPFADFKWKWASLQCTERINDPVILLGVLFRMRKLELLNQGIKYSSPEFAQEMDGLSRDVSDSIRINLSGRVGERNIIRNSSQYWRAVGLISNDRSGIITLTDFGRKVADREISQSEFAALTIQTFRLPNPQIQSNDECRLWLDSGLLLYPLRLILEILDRLADDNPENGYITPEELTRIVIPLSGVKASMEDYINFLEWYRNNEIDLSEWPNCTEGANDFRIAREYLIFLDNYGYTQKGQTATDRLHEKYVINFDVIDEIREIISSRPSDNSLSIILDQLRKTDAASELERKRICVMTQRPNQANFRHAVLDSCPRCVISNVSMPEVLEAAHIKPFKYNGEDTAANGFAMRADIHTLFDSGHLRISPEGVVELSSRARMDYGESIPPRITVPSHINRDFLKWRWDNYNGF